MDLNIMKETTLQQMASKTSNIENWTRIIAGRYNVNSWMELQLLIKKGLARQTLQIGQPFNMTWNNKTIPLRVMDFIDNNRLGSIKIKNNALKYGVIFQTLDCIDSWQFDEREAFFCAESGLVAGDYSFILKEHSYVSTDVNKRFYFTLENDVPVGGQLVFVQGYNVTLEGGQIRVFSGSDSTTVLETTTMSSTPIENATDIGELKNAFNGNLNSCQRALLGNNNWEQSAIRQRLNSDLGRGLFWEGKNKWDRPPSWNTSGDGFLKTLDTELLSVITECEIDTYKNTACDGGGLATTTDKIFLAGRNEVFMPKEGADNGVAFKYYEEGSTSLTPHAGADAIRIKNNASGNPTYWWLRVPYVGHAGSVRGVGPTGESGGSNAYNSCGVAPAFVIA